MLAGNPRGPEDKGFQDFRVPGFVRVIGSLVVPFGGYLIGF